MAFNGEPKFCHKAPPRERSQKYLDFVDGRFCVICGREQTTHHHHGSKGLGETLGDLECVPLCYTIGDHNGCHERYHDCELSYSEREMIGPGKRATLLAYVWTHYDCPGALALDHPALKAWLIENHPGDFDDPSNKRPRKFKAKIRSGQKIQGRKLQSRGLSKPTRPRCKMGERKLESDQ